MKSNIRVNTTSNSITGLSLCQDFYLIVLLTIVSNKAYNVSQNKILEGNLIAISGKFCNLRQAPQ